MSKLSAFGQLMSSGEITEIGERIDRLEKKFDEFAESIHTFLFSEEDYSPINRIHDKLDILIAERKKQDENG